ncbi:MAG: hypothetical protein GWP91_00125 [Rhodobacterales bacterium]|nr:hypothetical protein [Rhodobacterales bacterium]
MTLMDGQVVDAEIRAVAALADGLGVVDPRLSNLRQIRRRHLRLLQLDLLRRSPMGDWAWDALDKGGLRGLWRYSGQPRGWAADTDEAWRFKSLGLLPQGTLGRAYWTHMTRRRFPFPGEPGGLPAEIVRHDLVHVLAGHDTDVAGECQNASFIAGFLRDDPFSYLFMVAVHCHLDIEVFPNDPSKASMAFDPAFAIPALQRGLAVARDLYDLDWDYWVDLQRPIEEVRTDYAIEPFNRLELQEA